MNSNVQHFARQLIGAGSILDSNLGMPQLTQQSARQLHTSRPAKAAVGLPTLGDTGVKFNASRWGGASAESGMSVFDVKGAADALRNGPDVDATRRAHPAQLAHAARIARAQQQGLTFYGFKVFPDLTPGRAFMWGTVLAVYTVGAASYALARSCGVTSVGDIREKMQEAFAPYKEALQATAATAKGGLELSERPAALDGLREFGAGLAQVLGKHEQPHAH